jgi:DNA-binding XRE family transcriptional regulator
LPSASYKWQILEISLKLGDYELVSLRSASYKGHFVMSMPLPDIPLGSLVRFHRKRARLSQLELAMTAGVSRKVVQDLEGGRDAVSWRNVLAVLEVLNVRLRPEGPLVDEWMRETKPTDGETPHHNKKEDGS